MSRGLYALNEIVNEAVGNTAYLGDIQIIERANIIEKELKEKETQDNYIKMLEDRIDNLETSYLRNRKALEIIKNKPWLISEIVESKGDYKVYKSWCSVFRADMKYRATEEEYDLLKEVLL